MRKDGRHGPPPEEMPIMMLVNELSRLFHNRMRLEGERIGMQEGYRHMLFHLSHEDNLTQLELTRRAHLKAPTVSVALRKMETAGLVSRSTDPKDQRQTLVRLTEEGRRMDQQMQENIQRTEALFSRGLTVEEQESLKRLLLHMRENVLQALGEEA